MPVCFKRMFDKQEKGKILKRYRTLDNIRGIALINMIAYHGIWNLVYLFGMNIVWYQTGAGYIWQQAICWTFIILSGFCWSLGRNKLKNGLTVFGAGLLVTAVTLIFMPEERVVFGILTLLGSCMLLMIPLEKVLGKLHSTVGVIISAFLFIFSRNIAGGYMGFEGANFLKLPEWLYANLFTTYLGFPTDGFSSTDYFPLFPWIFLYIAGYYCYRIMEERKYLCHLENSPGKGLQWIGRHSLVIYIFHQPVLYTGMFLWQMFAGVV